MCKNLRFNKTRQVALVHRIVSIRGRTKTTALYVSVYYPFSIFNPRHREHSSPLSFTMGKEVTRKKRAE